VRALSLRAMQVLGYIGDGFGAGHGCRGRSEYGGLEKVLDALGRRGLIDREGRMTVAGFEELRRLRQKGVV